MAELVDAPDLGSGAFGVRVQVPLLAPWPVALQQHGPATILNSQKAPAFLPLVAGRQVERNRAMQVNIKDRQEVEATVEVIVPANEADNALNTVLRDLPRQARIPGFPPRQAPVNT